MAMAMFSSRSERTPMAPAGVLRAETRLEGARVSGLAYDVATGLVETIVQP